ncbi:MAG: serine/threonine-protein kinase [Hyphomicrobiaceae bacterium]|nr:serine/threonine-protein kinase [Hyphomicrobiaceae bacterium]
MLRALMADDPKLQPSTPGAHLPALAAGHELVGDFRIKRVLGAGGFGITYLAEEPALARLVTIKEYFPADYAARRGDEAFPRSEECKEDYTWGLERFIEEAQTLAKFAHPNIVQVYRYFRANSTGYMVLKFEEGGSFKAWLKGLKRAPRQAELDAILTPLLDALDVVHKGQFLHRDIAPDNIIIRKDGAPVLIDFGSARGDIIAHSKTVSALVKPGYSPYEQYSTDARQQGPWTDIYALGGTLYHAITGKRPPDAPTRMVNDDYVPAREAALSSYRPGFLEAIDKSLRLDVKERPQSIAEWRGMLLAPSPRRGAGEGRGLREALGLRSEARRAKPEAAAAADIPPAGPPAPQPALVPAPPDAPQAKGQLLDFIEGLRKHRGQAAPAPPKAAAAKAEAGGRPPAAAAKPAAAKPAVALAERPRAVKALPKKAEKRVPRPRRMPRLGAPGRWRSVAAKLLIGIAIASAAVYLQDPQPTPQPQVQGRGQAVLASQTGDLSQLGQLTGHKGAVEAIALADQGRSIVTAAADGTLKVWSAGALALQRTVELDDGPATALAAYAGDRRVLSGHRSGTIVLWDIEKAEKVAQFQHGELAVTGLAPLVDGNRFAAINAGGAIAVFDVRTPSSAPASLEVPGSAPFQARFVAAARSRGTIAFTGPDRLLRLWQLDPARTRSEGGRLVRLWRLPEISTSALDIASHGWAIAGGDADGMVRLWSTANARGTRSLKLHEGRVAAVAFAPGDRLLASAGEDGSVRLWDTWAGTPPRTLKIGVGPLKALAFSGDGRKIYAAGADGSVRIWSTLTLALSGN